MISVKGDQANAAMRELGATLERVEKLGRRTAPELIRRATADILLGSKGTGKGGGSFDGLAASMARVAPEPGESTREAQRRGYRISPRSTSYQRGLQKAKSVLGNDPSGVFGISVGKGGRAMPPARLYRRTRGKRKGSVFGHVSGRRAKTAVALGQQSGVGVRLNLQALAVAYALAYRESARGSLTAQFITRKYRRHILKRIPRNKPVQPRNVSVPLANASGTNIGGLTMNLAESRGRARITGEIGVPARHSGRVAKVVRSVTLDREAYLLRKDMSTATRKLARRY